LPPPATPPAARPKRAAVLLRPPHPPPQWPTRASRAALRVATVARPGRLPGVAAAGRRAGGASAVAAAAGGAPAAAGPSAATVPLRAPAHRGRKRRSLAAAAQASAAATTAEAEAAAVAPDQLGWARYQVAPAQWCVPLWPRPPLPPPPPPPGLVFTEQAFRPPPPLRASAALPARPPGELHICSRRPLPLNPYPQRPRVGALPCRRGLQRQPDAAIRLRH